MYTGSTKNLINRVKEHRKGYQKGFTQKYNVNRLVYSEVFEHIDMAKDREKQVKGWKRQRKIELIEAKNKLWKDEGSETPRPLNYFVLNYFAESFL